MASVFQDTTQALVRQLDPSGELIPVTSIIDVSCFRPFCLVKRTRTSFWGVRYVKTDFSLRDILEEGPELPEPSKDPVIKIGENTEKTMATGVTAADIGITGMITFSAGGSHNNYLEIQKLSVVHELESLRKRKLKVPEPNILKKLREHNENLYMVTEAVETLKDAKLEKRRKADAGIYVPLLNALQFKGSFSFDSTIHVSEGSILAFRVKRLHFFHRDWVALEQDEDFRGYFDMPYSLRLLRDNGDPDSIKQQQEPELPSQSTTGFQALQAQVKPEIHILETLTLKHRQSLMEALLGLLGQAKALQELEDTMNRALDLEEPVTPGFLGGPGDAILAKLQDASGKLNPSWAGSILYLLGALHELSEEQQQLLAMSVEKEILSQQLELMKTILDENFLRTEAGSFPLHCELLQSLQGEELTVTQALIGLCGLDLQGDGPLFAWDPDVLPPLCALYAVLSVFQALSRTSWFSSPFTKVLNTLNFSRRGK
ncbi:gasdermin-A-like [Monodelphis domestica]|uniref:gasdermin-A-like n=1 Tax=Monodelphis domestica TaxID=13616 RepID=UPI0024E1C542|nr:gasdermin-A-like [Monodelphis domestica]